MTKICLKFTFNACKRNKALKKLRNLKQTQNKPPFFSLALDSARRFHRLLLLNFPVKTAIVMEFSQKNFKSSFTLTKSWQKIRQLNLGPFQWPGFWDATFLYNFRCVHMGGQAGWVPEVPFFPTGIFLCRVAVYKLSSIQLSWSPTFSGQIFKYNKHLLRTYCAFHKHANSEVQKPTDDCVVRCRQSS